MKNIFTSFAATTVIQLVTMLGGVLTARMLLPTGKGELAAVILWPSLLAYGGNLGLMDALAFYASEREKDIVRVLASGFVIALPLSGVLVGIGYVILPLVWASHGPDALDTARLYLIYIPLNMVALSLTSVLWGRMRLGLFNLLRVFVQVGFVVGIILLYALDQVSVRRFAEASLVANLLTMVIAVGMTGKNHWLGWRPDVQIAKGLLGYGWRVHLGSIASQANLRLDQMLMSIFLPSRELGLYVVAVSVSGIVNLAASTLGIVAFPHIANMASAPGKRQALGRFVRLGLLLSVLAAVGAFRLTPWLLDMFFTSAYLPAVAMTRVLIVASIPLGLNTLLQAGLKGYGRPLAASQAELLGLGVTGLALWVLLQRYGALGAAWASLLAYSVVGIFLLYTLSYQIGVRAIDLWRPRFDDWDYVVRQYAALQGQMSASLQRLLTHWGGLYR